MNNILFSTNKLLSDTLYYLKSIRNITVCEKITLLQNASIGQHIRHYIEFYQGMLVNYEDRQKSRGLETVVLLSQYAIQEIQKVLFVIDTTSKIFLQSSFSKLEKIVSNIERELIYNYEHCLHHIAIIRIGLNTITPELILPNHFDVAPTTLEYRDSIVKRS